MNTEELYTTYLTALNIVSKASALVLEGFNKGKKVQSKDAHDLVTEYDTLVENYVKSELKKHFPQHGFLGEETSHSAKVPDTLTWILDPIDGTNNYVHGSPESAISLALTHNKEPIIGIVSCPMMQRLYSSCKGRGSFLNGIPIKTSSVKSLADTLIGIEMSLGSKSKKLMDKLEKRNRAAITNTHGVRSAGSAALSLCYVAQGMWDVYHVEELYPWDMAAGVLIIREAGGHVLDSLGGKFNIETGNIVAANSEEIANSVAELFRSVE